MELFSEDYLMHYGVKGMKWKKRKHGLGDDRPDDKNHGVTPGSVSPERSDDWDPRKNVPTESDMRMMRERRIRMERQARDRIRRRREATHYKENVGRSLARAKRSRGFSATDERKGDANYLHVTRDDAGGSQHLRYYKRKGGGYAPHR